jgi:hypothetical protein
VVWPEVKFIDTIDEFISDGRGGWAPPDPDDFGLLVTVGIGQRGGEGADNFDVLVCSPRWLAGTTTGEGGYQGGIWLRHYLVMPRWDHAVFRGIVEKLCNSVGGGTWEQVAEKLARYMQWEFEDFRPAP